MSQTAIPEPSPLSPAAQAVYVAFEDATTPEAALAAALRAAAEHCTYDRLTLYCLADELESNVA